MEASSGPDLKQILRLVYKKKVLFFLTAAAVTTTVVIFSYLLPKTYEAKSVIFIERNVLNELIKDVTVTSSFEEKVKALSVVMKSRSLILKVMRDLDLDIDGKSADQIEASIRNFQEKTQIDIEVNKTTRRDMDLFTVSYTGSNPKLASDYVNSLVRRYIEENLTLKRAEAYGASQFLLDQIATFKIKLEKIESAIARQRKDRTVPDQSISLYDQLQALQKRKNDLLVLYTENHPEVVKVTAEIEMLKELMQTAGTAPGPDMALLDLERERDTTKKIYEDLLATLRRSELSAQIEVQDKAGAFRIIDPAVVPTKPLSPKMATMILLAIVAGVAAGAGLIWVIDMTDNSVKSVETLKKMGLPILAVISTMQTEQEAAAIRRKNSLLYTIAGVYLAVLLAMASMESMGLAYVDDFIQGTRVEIGNSLKKNR